MSAEVRHPLFVRFFDRFSRLLERDIGRYREELTSGLSGRVVEVGAGNGINFRRYPRSVSEVVAIEPEPYLRARAETAAAAAPVQVTVRPGLADDVGEPDDSFDAAVACLMLCSVADQQAVLAEMRRLLQPGGELRFLEHVRSPRPGKARSQLGLDGSRIWPLMAGGCHCSRDTVTAIQSAGFKVEDERLIDVGPPWIHTNPHVIGRATKL